jgi:excisionase family DNA binding protein
VWTVPEIARRLRVDARTVRQWIRAGKLQAFDLSGATTKRRHIRVFDADLENFLNSAEIDALHAKRTGQHEGHAES